MGRWLWRRWWRGARWARAGARVEAPRPWLQLPAAVVEKLAVVDWSSQSDLAATRGRVPDSDSAVTHATS